MTAFPLIIQSFGFCDATYTILLVAILGTKVLIFSYRFLCYNSEWMQKTLGVTVREVDTLAEKTSTNDTIPVEQPKLQPWEDDLFRTPTPKEMAMHLCKNLFNF